jgi:dihydrofolate reductase
MKALSVLLNHYIIPTVYGKYYSIRNLCRQRRYGGDVSNHRHSTQHYCFSTYANATIPTIAAVKELSWCAPIQSRNNKQEDNGKVEEQKDQDDNISTPIATEELSSPPIPQFGIVAAMERTSRIIGIDGKLPWNIPEDRKYFKLLTTNKIIIVGRKTLYEIISGNADRSIKYHPLVHVAHTKHCIVISSTLTPEMLQNELLSSSPTSTFSHPLNNPSTTLHVVKSFDEALKTANQLLLISGEDPDHEMEISNEKNRTEVNNLSDSIQCWVAGGERIYEEAVKHPSAKVIHLTIVDNNNQIKINANNERRNIFDDNSNATCGLSNCSHFTKFPPNYRWDNLYTLLDKNPPIQVSTAYTTNVTTDKNADAISFCHMIYQRKKHGHR